MASLGSNLQEIYAACCAEGELVADPSGNHLYYSNAGWGRIWTAFYDGLSLFNPSLKEIKLSETLKKTEELYLETLPAINESVTQYKKSLEKRINGEEVEELHCLRQAITYWNQESGTFIHFMLNEQNARLKSLCKNYLIPTNWEEIQFIQALINIEGCMQEALPLGILSDLAQGKTLSDHEEHQLRKFIRALKKYEEEIPFGQFYRGLEGIAGYLGDLGKKETLLSGLADRDHTLFNRPDEEHLAWRNGLKPGDTIFCNYRPLVLGEQIGKKLDEEDLTLVFSLKDNYHSVVLIHRNRAVPFLKKYWQEKQHWGINPSEIEEIDKDGKCWIAERLVEPFKKEKMDEASLKALAGLINWWIKRDLIPVDFSLKYLMFDWQMILKYTKILMPAEFRFLPLEKIITEVAGDQLETFLYLMNQSGLKAHASRGFFLKMVKNALEGKEGDPKDYAAMHGVTFPDEIKAGIELFEEIKVLRRTFKTYPQDVVDQAILKIYQETGSASKLWQDFRLYVEDEIENPSSS